MIGDYYWDFQENNGPNVTGDPAISTGHSVRLITIFNW